MAPHRIDTHHHLYPPVYIKKTGDVLKRDYASYDEYITHQKQKLDEMIWAAFGLLVGQTCI